MVCRKLRNLVKQKRLKRDRYSMTEPYFYWIDVRPKHVEHRIGVNWVYTFLELDQSSEIHSFQAEPKEYLPIVQPDAFAVVKYFNKLKYYFVEFHREESGNVFDKISKYDALFKKIFDEKKQGKKSYWWVNPFQEQTFSLIVVTTGSKEKILNHVRNEKVYGYKVEVMTLDSLKEKCEIRKECLTNG